MFGLDKAIRRNTASHVSTQRARREGKGREGRADLGGTASIVHTLCIWATNRRKCSPSEPWINGPCWTSSSAKAGHRSLTTRSRSVATATAVHAYATPSVI